MSDVTNPGAPAFHAHYLPYEPPTADRRCVRHRKQYDISKVALTTLCGLFPFLDCNPAHAETNLTLYGRLDNGVEYLNGLTDANGKRTHRWRGQSGDWGTGMLGLQGEETLGAGLKVLFNLEQGLNTMNGAVDGGRMFNRWAYLGMSHPSWGTLSGGRMLWLSNGVWEFDPFVQQIWSSASLVRGRTWHQTSNNVRYQSPVFAGFDVRLQMALGNQTGFNLGASGDFGRASGAQLTYTHPSFQLRAIYDDLRDPNGRFSDLYRHSREWIGAVNVVVGRIKIQAAWTHMWAGDTGGNGAPDRADHQWLGVAYQINPSLASTIGAFHLRANGDADKGGGRATIIEAGTTYNLSKRTMLYATVAHVRNSAGARFGLIPDPITSANNPVPGGRQTGGYIGVNHSF
ncbi:porin [Robbsia andropogonis]|uniref:porin n=1 Tax=Robbsia andropogonis TaxID=28092 RepID=UPI003D1D0AFD